MNVINKLWKTLRNGWLLVMASAIAAGSGGCKTTPTAGRIGISPIVTEVAVSTLVSYGLRNSPKTAGYVSAVAPIFCSLAECEPMQPIEVVSTIKTSKIEVLKTPEGVLLVNGILILYTVAWDSMGTNHTTAPLHLKAACQGIDLGLTILPQIGVRARSGPANEKLLTN